VALLVAWVMTLYTLRLLIEMHECVPGVRFDRYRDLGVHALGPRLGIWVVVPQQLIVQVGCDVVYMVTGGNCLQKFAQIVSPNSTPLHQSYWICIFGSSQFLLSQLRDLNSITAISLAAAVMSLSYSTISWAACLAKGPVAGVSYAYSTAGTAADAAFRVCGALGQVAFAFAGHGVVLEIQATIPSTPTKPSKMPMWKGTVAAYMVTAACYFPVAFIGYWAFGQGVSDNVLVALERPPWLVAAANMMVVVHVLGSYQVGLFFR
jgi:amino acid permease